MRPKGGMVKLKGGMLKPPKEGMVALCLAAASGGAPDAEEEAWLTVPEARAIVGDGRGRGMTRGRLKCFGKVTLGSVRRRHSGGFNVRCLVAQYACVQGSHREVK